MARLSAESGIPIETLAAVEVAEIKTNKLLQMYSEIKKESYVKKIHKLIKNFRPIQ